MRLHRDRLWHNVIRGRWRRCWHLEAQPGVVVVEYRPGRQNGAHPLVTPVSPGAQAVLAAVGAITAGVSAAVDSAAITSRRTGSV
jgi:hypothetical protein